MPEPRFNHGLRYEHPGLGDDNREDRFAHAKMAAAKWTGDLLERNYPGHPWHVEVVMNKTGGLIKIRLNGIMPGDRWYVCQLRDVISDPGGRRTVLRGAGELLERYRIPRTGFNLTEWRLAMDRMPISARQTGRGHVAPLTL